MEHHQGIFSVLKITGYNFKNLQKPNTESVLCGDFNVDYLSNSDRKQQLSLLLSTYNMLHMVSFPTRLLNSLGTAIHNIFVENLRLHFCTVLPLVNGLSDHDAQCLIFKRTFYKKEGYDKYTQNKINHKRFNYTVSRTVI